MTRSCNLLRIGIKIRLKGRDNIDGIITTYWIDENHKIVGYIVKPVNRSLGTMKIALDDDIEVLKQ